MIIDNFYGLELDEAPATDLSNIIETPTDQAAELDQFEKPLAYRVFDIVSQTTSGGGGGGNDDSPPDAEDEEEEIPGVIPRPLPDDPRTRATADGINFYVLLVGINHYAAPIPTLNGCVNDVDRLAAYLQQTYGEVADDLGNLIDATTEEKIIDTSTSDDEIKTTSPIKVIKIGDRLNLCILKNEEATYDNIIVAFRKHLALATDGDSVWFHFSGHGAEQFTAKAFEEAELEPLGGKDQTLVCYQDTQRGRQLHLADKELAVLLHEVEASGINTIVDETSGKTLVRRPHLLVSLDCCHSGSGTRDHLEIPLLKVRNFRPDLGTAPRRELFEYIGNFDSTNPVIPLAKHLNISACKSNQKAGDLPGGGVFTSSLLQALQQAESEGKKLHYNALFIRTRAASNKIRKEQDPQFETLGGFDPYTCFLEGWEHEEGKPGRYEVYHNFNASGQLEWHVRCGAVHGLPATYGDDKIQVSIFETGGKTLLTNALVKKVGAVDSLLDFTDFNPEVMKPRDEEGRDLFYEARILSLPAEPIYIWVHQDGLETDLAALPESWRELERLNLIMVSKKSGSSSTSTLVFQDRNNLEINQPPAVELILKKDSDQIEVVRLRDPIEDRDYITLHPPAQTEPDQEDGEDAPQRSIEDTVVINLKKIARWKRMLALDKRPSKLEGFIDFAIVVFDLDDEGGERETVFEGNEIKVYCDENNLADNQFLGIGYQVELKKDIAANQELYFYGYYMGQNGEIAYVNEGPKILSGPKNKGQKVSLFLGDQNRGEEYSIATDQSEEIQWIKLIVTTEPINPEQLEQEPLISTRGRTGRSHGSSVVDDWLAITVKLTLARKVSRINETEPVHIGSRDIAGTQPKITIRPNQLRARVAMTTAHSGERSLDPAKRMAVFEQEGLSLVHFDPPNRSTANRNVLEILDIENPESLATNPLEIAIAEPLNEDEVLLPVFFDGQNFRIVGETDTSDDRSLTTVRIHEIPDIEQALDGDGELIKDPFGEEFGNRSIFKALKMAFVKTVVEIPAVQKILEKLNDTSINLDLAELVSQNKLRWVSYNDDGSFELKERGLAAKVKTAKHIILIVHGFFGNNDDKVKGLAQTGIPINEPGHVVLTYEYENLMTPIRKTARRLKTRLRKVGLVEKGLPGHQKLTIIAHSMGGLVSRAMIELEAGNNLVDHLVLLGTPNSGSSFAEIGGALNYVRAALDIALNFSPKSIPQAGFLLKMLKVAADLAVTLTEMDPDSDFLKKLNTSDDPGVPYFIIAGDARAYRNEQGSLGSLVDRIGTKAGDTVFGAREHDIAVSKDSIFSEDIFNGRIAVADSGGDTSGTATGFSLIVAHHLNYFTTENGLNQLEAFVLPLMQEHD